MSLPSRDNGEERPRAEEAEGTKRPRFRNRVGHHSVKLLWRTFSKRNEDKKTFFYYKGSLHTQLEKMTTCMIRHGVVCIVLAVFLQNLNKTR